MAAERPKIVVIGGGGGSVQVLHGLRHHTPHLTGVIAVTDTGRSTGKVRHLGNIPAPGDIRNGLGTLSQEHDPRLAELVQFRLNVPHFEMLDGVAFGNLMLMALTQITQDFAEAVNVMRQMLGVEVMILPVTNHSTHLCAELENGEIVKQEVNVRGLNKPPIKRLFLENPEARAYPACVQALREADLIAIGPGSLFTTVLACLVFEDIAQAIRESKAAVVYICNTTTHPGQTDNYSLADHVQQIVAHLGAGVLDYVILNTQEVPPQLVEAYAADRLEVLSPSPDQVAAIQALGVTPILAPVAEITEGKRELYNKQDSIRHDPERTAQVLLEILEQWTAEQSIRPARLQ